MEIVVLNSDIARLVLDYLKSQKLKRATHTFCKTSPFLKQEFSAYKQGLQTHSFFPELEEIICEYVKISRKVEQLLPKLTDALRSQFQQCKLSEKVNKLLELAMQTFYDDPVVGKKIDQNNCVSVQSSKTPEEKDNSNTKRKRNTETVSNSSNEENSIEKRHKLSSQLGHCSKKRRVLQPYCFLSNKTSQRRKRRYYLKLSPKSTEDDLIEEENEESPTSNENLDADDSDYLDDTDSSDEKEIFGGEKPTKESTPRLASKIEGKLVAPKLPEISQAILDNPEFQQKLVDNINQALNQSSGKNSTNNLLQKPDEIVTQNEAANEIPATREEISSGQLLDQMIKNILDATEKEPSFDAIIQEVVEASNKPHVQTAAVQCNINSSNSAVIGNPPLYTATDPPPLVPAIPVTQLQQFSTQSSTATEAQPSTRHLSYIPATSTAPPRTPIIIRSAVGPSTANDSMTVPSAQDPPSILASSSFGSLIDPNFSISKLIVLNSNDSAQKQFSENCMGNTTADNIISQLSTSAVADPNDEQVFFDATTGQLTFPIFLTNDGLITSLPFVISNETVNQQLQTHNTANVEGSRLEIPLSEPLVVNANQFPPNSVIINSAQKENIMLEKPVTGEKSTKEAEIKHGNTVPPASFDSHLLHDKATPASNGIVNTKAFKSLSTPRKRTSHVRTLTFSPRSLNAGTQIATCKDVIRHFASSLPKTIPEENKDKTEETESIAEQKCDKVPEKAVINAVEILPTIAATSSEALTENTNISTNDSSNIPPLFVSEESSNQTIINKTSQTNQPITNSVPISAQVENTPKRKQYKRAAAVRSCKRQISKTLNELGSPEEKPEKENEETTELDAEASKKKMMEEWLRLRNSNVDLDVRLREINASSQSQQTKKVNTKKRVRRKKPAAVKKKERELVKKAAELENSKETSNELQDELVNEIELGKEIGKIQEIDKDKEMHSGKATEKTKIYGDNAASNKDKKCKAKKTKNLESSKSSANSVGNSEEMLATNSESVTISPDVNEALEREKRNKNIAFLLETPFKDPALTSCIPPTPGIFAPTLETPAGKIKSDEMQASATFLFGSLTKSEQDTPLMSAITPGFRFTPFGMKDIGTPKSVPGTDYSSGGGSYYKPDESEDLDRNIDKMLKNSAQKKTDVEAENGSKSVQLREGESAEKPESAFDGTDKNDADKIEVEIPVEKLKVEPIVLKRVKSFGNESNECVESTAIDPHYTLASGLPEISAAEEECSSSSSSSSSDSSSASSKSSSSSSCSSSSSSSSSPSSNASNKYKTVLEMDSNTKKDSSVNDLDNLSEISSTEDEEWQKLAVTDNDENSQLVNNDGEVRYPVRSWLTPVKEKITLETKTIVQTEMTHTITSAKPDTIKVTLPLKSVEKRSRQVKELELKKQRIKDKLKIDASTITKKEKLTTTATTPPNISAALAASRVMHAMRDKGKQMPSSSSKHSEDSTATETSQAFKEKRSLDVLTALNLSAKKQLPKTHESPSKTSGLSPGNDQQTCFKNSLNKPNGKPKINIANTTPNKTSQRKCLPIEARPVTRTIRKTGKKIVRTPLAFKVIHSPGKINSHSTTTTLAELAASKTTIKSKECLSTVVQQTLRVSPRNMKTSTSRANKQPESPTTTGKTSTRSSKSKATSVAKSKSTRSQNLRNKVDTAEVPLEKEMAELVDDWKEDASKKKNLESEVEDDSRQKSSIVFKPKINLKARNAMVSTKQKKKVELPIQPRVESKKHVEKDLLEEETPKQSTNVKPVPDIASIPPQVANSNAKLMSPPILSSQTAVASVAANEKNTSSDYYEDDVLEDCTMTTIDEDDTRRFIKYYYNGSECPSADVPPHDFSNFQMVVAIDENEQHVWRINEGVCLFSSAPVPHKAPTKETKKRKIRTFFSENREASTSSTVKKSFSSHTPAASSTPVVNQTNSRLLGEERVKGKSISQPQPAEANKKSSGETSKETPNIKMEDIEDIESILSHLHGT